VKKNIVNIPYPFNYHNSKRSLTIAFGVGLFIFSFIIIVQPFDVLASLGIGILQGGIIFSAITTANCLLYLLGFPAVFKRYFKEEGWTVGKEIFWIGVMLLSISISNFTACIFLFKSSVIEELGVLNILFEAILDTFFIGMIPTTVIVLLNQLRLAKKHSHSEKIERELRLKNSEGGRFIRLTGENVKEQLEIELCDFFYAQADGNYVEVRYQNEEGMQKRVMRSTLKNFEDQLTDFSAVKRVHRKYLANLHTVIKVAGNAQGYKLHYPASEKVVPVSRKNSKALY
jgi:hypothetical protein